MWDDRDGKWGKGLTVRDLKILALVFGFPTIEELEDFIDIQSAKLKRRNGLR